MNLASEIGQMYFLKWLQLIFWKYLDFWKTPLHKPSKEQKIWFYFKSLTVPFSIFDAHVVSMPAVLKLSFTAIGIPSRMPSGWPALGMTVRQHRLKKNVCYIYIYVLINYCLFYTSLWVVFGSKIALHLAFDGSLFHFREPSSIPTQALSTLPKPDSASQSRALSPPDRQLLSSRLAIPKECIPLPVWPHSAYFSHRCC